MRFLTSFKPSKPPRLNRPRSERDKVESALVQHLVFDEKLGLVLSARII